MNANFISGQLRLLGDNLIEAKRALKGGSEDATKLWTEDSAEELVSLYAPMAVFQKSKTDILRLGNIKIDF